MAKSKFTTESASQLSSAFGSASSAVGSIGSVVGAAGSMVDAFEKNAAIKDTSAEHNKLDSSLQSSYDQVASDYDSLLANYNTAMSGLPMGITADSLQATDTKGKILNTVGAAASGAAAGASVAGPWGAVAGAVVGLGSGIAGAVVGNQRANQEASRLQGLSKTIGTEIHKNFVRSSEKISNKMFNTAALNLAALGGILSSPDVDNYTKSKIRMHSFNQGVKPMKSIYTGYGNYYALGGKLINTEDQWSNGIKVIGAGGSHELNPYGGVLMGVDNQGIPNLVEEGEVIFNDYVFSNRLSPTKSLLDEVKLNSKFAGEGFSKIASKLGEESRERPNDPISKNGLMSNMTKLTTIQEEIRAKEMAKQFQEAMSQLTPEEQQEVLTQMKNKQIAQEEQQIAQQQEQTQEGQQEVTPRAATEIDQQMEEQYPQEGYAKGGRLYGLGSDLISYAPAIGAGIQVLGDSFGLTNQPDYSNADRIEKANYGIRDVRATPIGGFQTFNPYDTQYQVQQLTNNTLATQRGIMNASSGNRAAAMSGLLAANAQANTQRGDIYKQAREYNDKMRLETAQFNLDINKLNSANSLEAQRANQAADYQRAQNIITAAKMRDELQSQLSEVRSTNRNTFYTNLGNIGKENRYIEMADEIRGLKEFGTAYPYIKELNGLEAKKVAYDKRLARIKDRAGKKKRFTDESGLNDAGNTWVSTKQGKLKTRLGYNNITSRILDLNALINPQ